MKTKRILVVDDDRDLVQTTKTFLEARGYEVSTAYSGVEARDELARQRPDLVVLDIMMDYDTDGFNVAYKLRNEPETERIPVIITSGFTKEIATKADTFAPMMDRDWPAAKLWQTRSPACWPTATCRRQKGRDVWPRPTRSSPPAASSLVSSSFRCSRRSRRPRASFPRRP